MSTVISHYVRQIYYYFVVVINGYLVLLLCISIEKLRDPKRFHSDVQFIATAEQRSGKKYPVVVVNKNSFFDPVKIGYYPNEKPTVKKVFDNLEQLEQEVPKLPLPELENTIEEYLRNLKPILTDSQYERAEKLASEFISDNGIGQSLQRILMIERHKQDNWGYRWWLNDMYLDNLSPLPINSNPGMVFAPRENELACGLGIDDMAIFGAKVILAALEFKNLIDENKLPIEYAAGQGKQQPLCMAQYKRLFTSYRVPGMCKDDLIKSETDYTQLNPHITVICNNQFYVVQLTATKDGDYITEEALMMQLRNIIDENIDTEYRVLPVGILTAHRREVWAECRRKLMTDEDNRKNIHAIESSVLILCFDLVSLNSNVNGKCTEGESIFKTLNRDETNMLHQMIHGGGSSANSGNRWFDKTIQFIVSPDGVNGICYEHSPAEGVAVIQAMESILKKCKSIENYYHSYDDLAATAKNQEINFPRKLEWYLGNKTKTQIRDAMQFVDKMINDFDTYVYRFTEYGKDYMKSRQVSPDGYMQLALQLTYYRMYGRFTATYESASTRRFLLGRVDCIRSATIEALAWVQAMDDSNNKRPHDHHPSTGSSKQQSTSEEDAQILKREKLFRAAMNKQSRVTKDNIFGYGIDVHLLALQQLAKENSIKVGLFEDESFQIANHFALSTSQVTTNDDSFMGYGAVVDDGYGASYNIKSNSVTFCVSSFKSNQTTDNCRFVNVLKDSLMMMKQMLDYSYEQK